MNKIECDQTAAYAAALLIRFQELAKDVHQYTLHLARDRQKLSDRIRETGHHISDGTPQWHTDLSRALIEREKLFVGRLENELLPAIMIRINALLKTVQVVETNHSLTPLVALAAQLRQIVEVRDGRNSELRFLSQQVKCAVPQHVGELIDILHSEATRRIGYTLQDIDMLFANSAAAAASLAALRDELSAAKDDERPPALKGNAATAAGLITSHPGESAKFFAKKLGLVEQSFRALFSRHLKPRGFRGGGDGYHPPTE